MESPFVDDIDKCVVYAFDFHQETRSGLLKSTTDFFIECAMFNAETYLYYVCQKLDETTIRVLPWTWYEKFMNVCFLVDTFRKTSRMKNRKWLTEDEYSKKQSVTASAARVEGVGETHGNKLLDLLATLKQIVDELEKLNKQ